MNYPYLPFDRAPLFIGNCIVPNSKTIIPPEIKSLPYAMRRHADLGICVISENTAVCPPDTFMYYKKTLSQYGFNVIKGETNVGCNYPSDSAYNVGIIKDKCFVNKDVCDPELFKLLEEYGYKIIHVKQGYAKCSICMLDENTIITGDESIRKAAEKNDIEAVFVSNESIILDGFNYGFIGGCMGKADKHTLLVNGELEKYKQGQIILNILEDKKITPLPLRKGALLDIGSIIPLMAT